MRLLLFLLAPAMAFLLPKADAAPLTPAQTTQAAKLLTSDNPADRAGAVRGFRSQGDGVKETYRGLLEKAEAFHKERLKTRIDGSLSPLRNFAAAEMEWATAKEACLELLYQKSGGESRKLAELARSYATAEKAMKELAKPLKTPPAGLATWEASAAALNEIDAELAWCRDAPDSDQEHFRSIPAADRAREMPAGNEFLELAGAWRERIEAQAAEERTALFNSKEIRWPTPPLKTFMELINARRYVLGLIPLRLDERLSASARDHSKEMQDLKFFAHESPTEKNKTPWDRAKNAAFEGRCMGENIFMGNASAASAFMAWWESDGHRFIMFQKEANTLGLGLVGVHWTLNTGTRDWTEAALTAEKAKRPG